MINKLTKLLFLVLILTFLTGSACASNSEDEYYPARIKNISNESYFPAVFEAIKNAKESIYMVMYLVSFNPDSKESPVYKLVNELVSAKKRGVEVKVILDRHRTGKDKESGVNYNVYGFLTKAGIDVRFDDINTYTHNKVIVIDENVLIIGSANWSVAALAENNETNVIVNCPALASELIQNMQKIKLAPSYKNNTTSAENKGAEGFVDIPYKFILNNSLFGRMGHNNDERSLDIYLILLRESGGNYDKPVSTTYEKLAEELRLTKKMDRTACRRQINKTLKKLDKQYGLIKTETAFNKPFTVTLIDIGGEYLRIPKTYWEWDWDYLLKMREKTCLFINLAQLGNKKGPPEWSMSRSDISKKYGISVWMIEKGMSGLNRYNILDIEHSTVEDKDYASRDPNVYIYKGLYSIEDFQKGLVSSENIYGKNSVTKARRYAAVVNRQYDLSTVKDLIMLTDLYGNRIVAKAFTEVGRKRPDNPQRTFKYAIGIMKKLSE